jgi:hypothetical protein
MKNKTNLAFTILESTAVLLITTVILGSFFSLSNITKSYRKFQENIFLFNQDLKYVLDLSTKGNEFNLSGTTSTLCGTGIVLNSQEKKYYLIAYATISSSTVIDCLEIASTSPNSFDFSINSPNIYISKTGNFTNSSSEALIRNLELVEDIKLATNTLIDFATASIVFINPLGEPIGFYSTSSNSYKLNFDDSFHIIFIKNNERSTTTIFKTGKIISK